MSQGPFFKMYTQYVNNFEHAMGQVELLKKSVRFVRRLRVVCACECACTQHPRFASYLSDMQKQPTSNGLDLMAFLITPVQRIPRYELLVKEVLKHTPNTHVDFMPLQVRVCVCVHVCIVDV
jgi:hypothetical protein